MIVDHWALNYILNTKNRHGLHHPFWQQLPHLNCQMTRWAVQQTFIHSVWQKTKNGYTNSNTMLSMSCRAHPRRSSSQGESVLSGSVGSCYRSLFASLFFLFAAVAACYWDNRKCSRADAWGGTCLHFSIIQAWKKGTAVILHTHTYLNTNAYQRGAKIHIKIT